MDSQKEHVCSSLEYQHVIGVRAYNIMRLNYYFTHDTGYILVASCDETNQTPHWQLIDFKKTVRLLIQLGRLYGIRQHSLDL